MIGENTEFESLRRPMERGCGVMEKSEGREDCAATDSSISCQMFPESSLLCRRVTFGAADCQNMS